MAAIQSQTQQLCVPLLQPFAVVILAGLVSGTLLDQLVTPTRFWMTLHREWNDCMPSTDVDRRDSTNCNEGDHRLETEDTTLGSAPSATLHRPPRKQKSPSKGPF